MANLFATAAKCSNCLQPCANSALFCIYCTALLIEADIRCHYCKSVTLPQGQCPWCLSHVAVTTLCGLTYHPIVASFLIAFKKRPTISIAKGLITPLSPLIKEQNNSFDAIIPIPQHWRRRIFRPLNPASLLAQALSKEHDISIDTTALVRSRYTKHQFGSSVTERKKQQRSSFRAVKREYQRVVLFDDVITTGATIDAAVLAYRRKNPQSKITIIAIARADVRSVLK